MPQCSEMILTRQGSEDSQSVYLLSCESSSVQTDSGLSLFRKGLHEAHKRWGKLPWERVVMPSAILARGWRFVLSFWAIQLVFTTPK